MALRTEVTAIAGRGAAAKSKQAPEPITALGVVAPPPIQVESPRFSGSLAMLFNCVRDHKVDLLDVPLLPICQAYFEYLLAASLKDLEPAAAALSALAYLLERKAWALLPVNEPEPEAECGLELPAPTTYEYQEAIQALILYQEERERLFFRPFETGPAAYELPINLGNVSGLDLARAFQNLLNKATPEVFTPLNKARRSLAEQMKVVLRSLSEEWKPLDNLIAPPFTREDAVYWFLSILELIRLGQATVRLKEKEVQFARTGARPARRTRGERAS